MAPFWRRCSRKCRRVGASIFHKRPLLRSSARKRRMTGSCKSTTPQGLWGGTVRKEILQHASSPFWLIGHPRRKGHPDYAASPTTEEKPKKQENSRSGVRAA